MKNRHSLDNARYGKEVTRSCWRIVQEGLCIWLIGDPGLTEWGIDFHCMGHWFDSIRVHRIQLLNVGQPRGEIFPYQSAHARCGGIVPSLPDYRRIPTLVAGISQTAREACVTFRGNEWNRFGLHYRPFSSPAATPYTAEEVTEAAR